MYSSTHARTYTYTSHLILQSIYSTNSHPTTLLLNDPGYGEEEDGDRGKDDIWKLTGAPAILCFSSPPALLYFGSPPALPYFGSPPALPYLGSPPALPYFSSPPEPLYVSSPPALLYSPYYDLHG